MNKKIISIILKIITSFFALSGVILNMKSSNDTFMGGTTVLMYFTIQSNILIAIISLIDLYLQTKNKKIPNYWYIIKYIGTISITLTGLVFCFVLAPTMGKYAWNNVNIYTHVIVPISAIIDFFITSIDTKIEKKNALLTIIPPILYTIFAGIGYILNWQFAPNTNYPYFFLNWGSPLGAFGFSKELPFMGPVWWILLQSILVLLTALFYLYILDLINKYRGKKCKK